MAKGTGSQSGGPGGGKAGRGREINADTILGEKVGAQGGSNPGGVYRGKDGVERYVKFYTDPAQAYGEVLANTLYNDLGLSAPSSVAFDKDGKVAFASKMIKDAQGELGKVGLTSERAKRFLDGFAADVLTANWDAAGLTLDNVVERAGGRLTRIDNGGTFLMRAQAGRKPQALLNKATEIDGLFSSSINPSYAKIAKSAGYANARAIPNLKQQVNRITRLRDQSGGWGSYVNRVAPSSAQRTGRPSSQCSTPGLRRCHNWRAADPGCTARSVPTNSRKGKGEGGERCRGD